MGIDKYADCPLEGCVNDCRALYSVWREMGMERGSAYRLFNEHATRERILDFMAKMAAESVSASAESAEFRCWVHFSGHGGQMPGAGDAMEDDGRDECIYAHGLVPITDNELLQAAAKFAPNAEVLFTIDACHSGTVLDLPSVFGRRGATTAPIFPRGLKDSPAATVVCMSACQDRETAGETERGGYFTSALISALKEQYAHKDRAAPSAAALFYNVREGVRSRSCSTQSCLMSSTYDTDCSFCAFALPPALFFTRTFT